MLSTKYLILFVVVGFFSAEALADVYIPPDEYLGYFDSNGIYTIVGNVKNTNDFAVLPIITVSVMDDSQIFSEKITHIPIAAQKEIPFKIKFPQVESPILLDADLSFTKIVHLPVTLEILYDETLIKHEDGHLTGRVQNTGNDTIHFPTIHAVVHGHDYVLDIVQNIELIEKIEPGQIVEFSMYPDPSIKDDVFYYSCFAPVDTTVIPVSVKKNDGKFDFRYDSGAWFSAAKFDENGTTMTMRGYNSYPLETYANFEFAPISGNEEFSVTLDGTPIEFIQSMDDMGLWHVAFTVEPRYQGELTISGFEVGLAEMPLIPEWIKTSAGWWSTNQISDSEFLEGIDFLVEKQILENEPKPNWNIPSWVKILSSWWYEDKISDEDFLNAITFLLDM